MKSFLEATIAETQAERLPGAKLSKPAGALVQVEKVEKDHGRIEIRRYYQSDQLSWFADLEKWEGLKSVGVVESIRDIDGEKTVERRYYLSSLPLDVELFARAVRSHWGVEIKCTGSWMFASMKIKAELVCELRSNPYSGPK